MNLVFVEEPEQIACALAIAGNDSLLVAMAPNVMFALKKEKRSFVIPEDYYDNNDLQKEWHAYFALSNSIISRVDDWIVSYNGISFPNALIRPLEFNAQMFFNMFRQIVVSIFVLEKIFAKENPKKIFFPEVKQDSLTYRLYFETESLIGQLIPLMALGRFEYDSYQWAIRPLSINAHRTFAIRVKIATKRWLKRIFSSFSSPEKKSALIIHGGYDLDYVIPELKKQGFSIIYLEDLLKKTIALSGEGYFDLAFTKNNSLTGLFEYARVNFFPVVKSRIQFYLDNIFPGYLSMYPRLSKELKERNVKVFAGSHSPSRVFENLICSAAKAAGIKVISFQHGCYGERFNHTLHVNDFDNPRNDYFFAWGQGVVNYAKKYNLTKVKVVPIGSASIDVLVSKSVLCSETLENRRTILYVPTSLRVKPKCRMLPGEYADNSYYLLQEKIITSVSQNTGINLLVRLHPSDAGLNPIADFIKESGFINCRNVHNSLIELMPRAGLVISDFMSTTLIQALAMNKNIMFYIDQSSMLLEPQARELLEKCVYCFDDLSQFLNAIAEYARIPGRFPLKNNRDFLRYYGTHLDDGKSASRAAKLIEEVAAGIL